MSAPVAIEAFALRIVKMLATNDVGGSCDQLSWYGIIEVCTAIEEGREDDARLLLETIEQREAGFSEMARTTSQFEAAEKVLNEECDRLSEQLQHLSGVVAEDGRVCRTYVKNALQRTAEELGQLERELQGGAGGES